MFVNASISSAGTNRGRRIASEATRTRSPRESRTSHVVMKSRVFLSLFVCGAIAYACGPRTRTSESAAAGTRHRRAPQSAPLISKLDVDTKDGVKFALFVTNQSAKRVEVTFPNAQTHDFLVLDSLGTPVWKWSEGRMFTSALRTSMIDVDDTESYENGWDAEGKHGKFTVVATLESSNFPVEQRADFRLP